MSNPRVPQHCPSQRELDDLELLMSGALAPISAFNEQGSPVTLTLPASVAEEAAAAGAVELVDPEGLPLARVTLGDAGWTAAALTHAQYGPFRRYYLSPAQVRERYAGRTFVPVVDALTDAQLQELRTLGPVVLVVLVGHGTPELSPVALIRATLAATGGIDAAVVAVPLASHDDADVDHRLGVKVVDTYAGPDPVHGLTDGGEFSIDVAAIVASDRPRPEDQGLVLFFTGLSGSGKSTLARALMDKVLEQGGRSLTSLDGDVVRRNLSAGLSFSKADRETNIRRIGWVAAEIARHGGVTVCSPIAPFDETRQQVRQMVDEAGGAFFLVHVATPLEECERRDRKGLYAKARAGEIPEFTGISSPYEEPEDADIRVDTTGRTIEDALDDVILALRDAGYLDLTDESVVEQPIKVLFVCTANICRSPYMELTARSLAGPDSNVAFSSAGTHGFRDHAMDAAMSHSLAGRTTSSEGFRSRRVTTELLEEADVVLTAEATHRTFILDDHPRQFRKVFTLGQFAEAASNVELTGRELLAAVGERRGTAEKRLDVGDPYGRGPEAAEACGQHIDSLLRVVVPALTASERITPWTT
ncbi:adenylyl-sulfate kinase [Nocardioides psychrotolerans]|uniref:Adenylyl-sulfate kinase n=1 Tax=Nocardioides psychrotolerans TaxID=1005945 RepID=A0A1I3N5A9_9ACTN|nr:adenylyl-sulfate kinase [Nocardioides psychrotolerans]SFJ04407.1 sulfate adenylyltransferase [Nocardioides psychrotolerans]